MITGTHISYYLVCHRKLWLFANGIQMEHTSELVAEGRLIHETSYPQRSERYQEIEIDGIRIDYYDARNKVIHEVKKSDKLETAHEWQLKYYIYVLERNGVEGVTAILEYPKLRRTTLLPGIGSGGDLQAYAGRSPDLQIAQQTGNSGETF